MKRYRILIAISTLIVSLASAQDTASPATQSVDPIDPVEAEYQRLLELDDAALTAIDEMIRASQRPDSNDAERISLQGRIKSTLSPVHEAYDEFIKKHPNHAKARLTYASFLEEVGEEHKSLPHLLKAVELAPELPAAWNNLANYYGHYGDPKKALINYEKAIAINPKESVYYHNFGTTVYLFRKDVKEHYGITEEEVFDKALGLYEKARTLDPDNFDLAEDIAQTYYGIRTQDSPSRMARPKEALAAWRKAEALAPSEFEKQGVFIHLARVFLDLQDFKSAHRELLKVELDVYAELRDRVGRRVPGYDPVLKQAPAPPDGRPERPTIPEQL